MTVAWVFPGQGSQKPGMGKSIIEIPHAKERFVYASEIFGRDLLSISNNESNIDDPKYDLNNTINTQICLFLVESILIDALKEKQYAPQYVAGHSLGEITGLYCSNVLTFENCIKLIKKRSDLMSMAAEGSMAALIGFDRDELNEIINQIDDVVIANDNSSSQVVLSGSKGSLQSCADKLKCKKFIELNVSGAFHSPFMKVPSDEFAKFLDLIEFNTPLYPLLCNSNPNISSDPEELKLRLKDQMCNGVRWRETMDLLAEKDELHIIEIGPSNVLSGLAKRHIKNVQISQVSSSENLSY
tara:strand:+ start:1095 stop:1991 length:897 start_codon:yes stop_codon:yes gene_type:complete